jgi:hypothetical protein
MIFYRRFPTEESCQLDFKKKRAHEGYGSKIRRF